MPDTGHYSLIPMKGNKYKKIILYDMKELVIGRNIITRIRETLCSRKQVTVLADYKTHQIMVRHHGKHPSRVNGHEFKDQTHILHHGDIFELVTGKLPYLVQTLPIIDQVHSDNPSLKRIKLENDDEIIDQMHSDDPSLKRIKLENDDEIDSKDKTIELENKCHGSVVPHSKNNKIENKTIFDKVDTDSPSSTRIKLENKKEIDTENKISDVENKFDGYIIPQNKKYETENKLNVTGSSTWEIVDSGTLLIYTSAGIKRSSKVAAYDLDGTLIKTKSGNVFPKDKHDWQISFPQVKPKLSGLIADGYKIVIFTNQGGIGRGNTKQSDFQEKVSKIAEELNVPIQVFIAVTNKYRKPAPGMWNVLNEEKNTGVNINIKESFYVGDGAGRVVNWAPGKKKDFSCADRLFALNLNLTFFTPEEHFLGQSPATYALPNFNPKSFNFDEDHLPFHPNTFKKKKNEVIILVGYPASGKSFFTQKYLIPQGYVHINRDSLGTWQKCINAMESALKSNKSVVIDNTNPDKASRNRFISKAKDFDVRCRCFYMTTSKDVVQHNNKFRQITDSKHVPVNDMIINSFKEIFS
uniref:PNK FHA domain-containing protein n=1 Tax=Clastoptera arizonana TaxID=38151 RepID=A0A1B6DS87_9HEMI